VLTREAERLGALAVRGDLKNPKHLAGLVDRTLEAFGGVDVLVLNGGGPPRTTAVAMTPDEVEDTVELLLTSSIRLVDLCLPHLRANGRGRIVAITSTSVREPIPNLALSNTIRPGVVGWLKTLAREVGPDGVTVNIITPGRIDTDRLREVYGDAGPRESDLHEIPLRRVGKPREVGDVVSFLASDRAAYVTGAVVPVDGGMTRGLL
jgi:3-oxoacyl-[acyl-carrier protein] reductase